MKKIVIALALLLLTFVPSFADIDTFDGVTGIDTFDGKTGIGKISGQTVYEAIWQNGESVIIYK